MPREIVRISLASKFPIEVGARFFATIAYPDNQNREREISVGALPIGRTCESERRSRICQHVISHRSTNFCGQRLRLSKNLKRGEIESWSSTSLQLSGWLCRILGMTD